MALDMVRYFTSQELRKPLLTLAAASILATALLAARIVLTRHIAHLYLVWNVFLAWIPVVLALCIEQMKREGRARNWRFRAAILAWLLFFPNAPYIFTDLTHLKPFILPSRWWSDLILILFFAIIGLVLSFISLHRVQEVVTRRHGSVVGWMFVFVVAFLTGFGVYLGRFERWNTWDVLLRPLAFAADSSHWLSGHSVKFTMLFGMFVLTAYALLYSLTTLSSAARETNRTPLIPK